MLTYLLQKEQFVIVKMYSTLIYLTTIFKTICGYFINFEI